MTVELASLAELESSRRRIATAAVSMPLSWEALAVAEPGDFRLSTAPQKLGDNGDAWQAIFSARHDLARILNPEGS